MLRREHDREETQEPQRYRFAGIACIDVVKWSKVLRLAKIQ